MRPPQPMTFERVAKAIGALCGLLLGSVVIAFYVAFFAGAVVSVAEIGWKLGRWTW